MKRLLLLLAVLLVFPLVYAGDSQCKPVHAQLGEMVFHDPGCTLGGLTYVWCAERSITGTLNGTYRFYSAPELNGWDLEVPPDAIGASWWVGVAYAISEFETQRGMLFTQEVEVWHWGELEGWGAHYSITGGTEKFDGATGWMASGGSWDSMTLVGEVCTP